MDNGYNYIEKGIYLISSFMTGVYVGLVIYFI